jgi:hypothetical protein
MKINFIVCGLVFALTGCASWCDDSEDRERCLKKVHAAQAVGAVAVVVTAVVIAAKAGGGSGGGSDGGGGSSGGNSSSRSFYYPGNCQYDWQTAADGSRCGARSAQTRPGGY